VPGGRAAWASVEVEASKGQPIHQHPFIGNPFKYPFMGAHSWATLHAGNRTHQYEATTCPARGSFDVVVKLCRASGGPSCVRHDVLLWSDIPMRLFGGVSAAPGYGVLVPKGRWLKVLQGKLSLCTGGREPSLAG
jgi:hypothetical protein